MDFAEEDENAESEDFEAICNLAVGTILRLNMTETRSDNERARKNYE
jgi:hypothetical protein